MTIYEVFAFTDTANIVRYFEPTLKLARATMRQLEKDGHSGGAIYHWEVKPTKAGIAEALNRLMSETCLNEA